MILIILGELKQLNNSKWVSVGGQSQLNKLLKFAYKAQCVKSLRVFHKYKIVVLKS